MARCNFNFTLISINTFLFFLFTSNLTTSSAQLIPNASSFVCLNPLINCGQGTCKASNASFLGFDCDCHDGWSKLQVPPFTFPSCIVPNCTVDFQCGRVAAPSPPPPPPALPTPPACAIVWCGEGNCVTNGTGHTCQCPQGSANLFNNSDLACFKECSLGADCSKLGLGPSAVPPPPITSGSAGSGSNEVPNCSRKLQAMTMIVAAAASLAWF